MSPSKKLDECALKRRKHSYAALALMAGGGLVMVLGIFFKIPYSVYIGLGLWAFSLVYAAVFVDPSEKRFYTTFEEEYIFPRFEEAFGKYAYSAKSGLSKEDVTEIGFIEKGRRYITRRRFAAMYRGVVFDTSHVLFRHNARGKLSPEIKPTYQAQLIRMLGLTGYDFPDITIRPKGVEHTEGLRYRMNREKQLVPNAGTEEFARYFEVLCVKPEDAECLDERLCGMILNYRACVRNVAQKAGLFIRFIGESADLMIGNWDNMLMPPLREGTPDVMYRRYVDQAIDLITDFVDILIPKGREAIED